METELWNLAVKGNDLTAYTQRFQELIFLCTKMFPEEGDRVEKFIGGLFDNIQGNGITAEPMRLQDAIRVANNLMDQKLKGYAARNAENRRRLDNNPRDNRVQQPPLKRQDVARDYTVGNNKNKGYARILPLCDKCKVHHHGPCPIRCGNCKKVGHQARDCWASTTMISYGCRGKGHTKSMPRIGTKIETEKLVRTSTLLWVRPSPKIHYVPILTNASTNRNFIFTIISHHSGVASIFSVI
ncbi:reverse transcriptase domain-containing protein [Tanacetum coccineum]